MQLPDYSALLQDVARHGATIDVIDGELAIEGEIPVELERRVRTYADGLVAHLLVDRRVDARTAALELHRWLEAGLLASVDRRITIQPGVTVRPENIEFAVRNELQLAKGKSHRARVSRMYLQAMHAALAPWIASHRDSGRLTD